ncbi:MAG: extracellular solute-binding protein [Chloroflexi bacterium]|nr:extracellular solute-binding protein [Chloroflexota bacterium]
MKLNRLLVAGVLVLALLATLGGVSAQEQVTINWVTISGFYTDWAEQVATQFEAETGIDINILDVDIGQLYETQVLESVADTGAYDLLTYDAGQKAEFAESGYLLQLDEYIAAADPAVIAFEDIAPALREVTSMWRGGVYGLPYYTFTMGYFYRCDLFENADEMAAFEAAYGYPLGIPRDYNQMADIAEFFRRTPGQTLGGQEVTSDFYGIGVMAGRFDQVQDEINSIAWSQGAQVINDDGTPGVDDPEFLAAVDLYVNQLLPFAPPGALSSSFDQIVAQMQQGLIAQTAAFFLDQYANMARTETMIEGARICTAPAPGVHSWVGAFGVGVSSDSRHPQEAFDFLAWLAGPEAQRQFAIGGGTTCRESILTDTELISQNPTTMGHYPTLVAVLNHTAEANFYPNYLFVPQGGKIYDEMTTWYSTAAAGEMSIEEAMANMATAIERQCGGVCEIANEALGEDYTPVPMAFDYDAFIASGAFDIDVWIGLQGG